MMTEEEKKELFMEAIFHWVMHPRENSCPVEKHSHRSHPLGDVVCRLLCPKYLDYTYSFYNVNCPCYRFGFEECQRMMWRVLFKEGYVPVPEEPVVPTGATS